MRTLRNFQCMRSSRPTHPSVNQIMSKTFEPTASSSASFAGRLGSATTILFRAWSKACEKSKGAVRRLWNLVSVGRELLGHLPIRQRSIVLPYLIQVYLYKSQS
jgi:hypothetical protein